MKIEKPRKFNADEVMARLDEVSYVPGKNPNKQKTRKRCRNGEPV
jgi:cytochrome c-type biogenesis protein CcmE